MRYTEAQMSSDLLDQPLFEGEPKKLVICSTPRSGSYMLCRFMIHAGLGVPHEYFNPLVMRAMAPRLGLGATADRLRWRPPGGRDRLPFGRVARAAEAAFLDRYIAALMARRCQGGVFAAKVHFEQYTQVLDTAAGWRLLDGSAFVYLYREDLLRQAISARFAFLTGRWSIDRTVTTPPETHPDFFDAAAIDRLLETLANGDRGWRMLFARNGIRPLFVSYEQLCADPALWVQRIALHLGCDPAQLQRGYAETGSRSDEDAGLPDRQAVTRHYLAAVRRIGGGEPGRGC